METFRERLGRGNITFSGAYLSRFCQPLNQAGMESVVKGDWPGGFQPQPQPRPHTEALSQNALFMGSANQG